MSSVNMQTCPRSCDKADYRARISKQFFKEKMIWPPDSTFIPVRVPTFGLKQLVFITRSAHVQQTTITSLLVNILITTGLPVYGNGVPI